MQTASEYQFDHVMREAGVKVSAVPVSKIPTPDRIITLGETELYVEIKGSQPNEFEKDKTIRRENFGSWGAGEGESVLTPNNRLRWTGWAEHFRKSIAQLSTSATENSPTLIAIESRSIVRDMDSTSLFLFLYGHSARVINSTLRVQTTDSTEMPVISTFSGWENISGILVLKDQQFNVYPNCFARIPIRREWFHYSCFRKIFVPGSAAGDTGWMEWKENVTLPTGVLE